MERQLSNSGDRGPQIPWEKIPESDFETSQERMIWQEQVTSLLPTLMEFTRQAGEWISRHVSQEWEKHIVEDGDPFTAVEPGRILFIFSKYKLGNLPDSLYRLLVALKDARNNLAHIKPIDSTSIDKVWTYYCLAQDKFGK